MNYIKSLSIISIQLLIWIFTTQGCSSSHHGSINQEDTLKSIISRTAVEMSESIPSDQPWMVLISIKDHNEVIKPYHTVISNHLIQSLLTLKGTNKCYLLTTPDIRQCILEEQNESLTDLYNEESGAKIGNLTRSNAVLEVSVQPYTGQFSVNMHLVYVETGTILWSGDCSIPKSLLPEVKETEKVNYYSSYKAAHHAIQSFPFPPNKGKLEVSVWPTKVVEGNKYNIFCKNKAPGYLYLFALQSDGTMKVILPNCIPLEQLSGNFYNNYMQQNSHFKTSGYYDLTATFAGEETILSVLTEHELNVSKWEKQYTELGLAYPQYYEYTFGRHGTIRDSLQMLTKQLNDPATGYWYADSVEFTIVE